MNTIFLLKKKCLIPILGWSNGMTMHISSSHIGTVHVLFQQIIMECYSVITIVGNVMTVNNFHIFVTTFWHIRFGTAEYLTSMYSTMMIGTINQVKKVYLGQGFCFQDRQFEWLQSEFANDGIILSATSKNKHIPETKRQLCTLKERA